MPPPGPYLFYNGINGDARGWNAEKREKVKAARELFIAKYARIFKKPIEMAMMMREVGLYSPKTYQQDISRWIERTMARYK